MASVRRRRAIAFATLAFVALSALIHFAVGPLATLLKFPEPDAAPKQLPFIITITKLVHAPQPPRTPKPVPVRRVRVMMTQPRRATPAKVRQMTRLTQPQAAAHVNQPVAAQPLPSPAITPSPRGVVADTPAPIETPVDASDVIVDARFRNQQRPVYPDIAIFGDEEGTVVILVTIGPDGEIINARVEQASGSLAIDQAALKAAEASTYMPPEVDGQPATMTYRVVYTFQLSSVTVAKRTVA